MTTAKKRYSNTTSIILCGLFAALTAVCSFITIPLGFTPIPLNLGTLGMFLTGGILGKKYGTLSITAYVLMGAAGIPVFAGFRAGVGVLLGPTGGYIAGYIAGVFIIGSILDAALQNKKNDAGQSLPAEASCQQDSAKGTNPAKNAKSTHPAKKLWIYIAALSLGMAACYFLGSLWFMYSTNTGLYASLLACVFPFLAGDAIKIIVASLLIRKLRPLLC